MDHYDDLAKLFESADGDLFRPKAKKHVQSADDRLVESFDQITNFVRKAGHLPNRNADDIKEAALGARLDNIRSDKVKLDSLTTYDALGLLTLEKAPDSLDELFESDNGLFSSDLFDIKRLPNQGQFDKRKGDTAKRTPVKNFDDYKTLFIKKQEELKNGISKLVRFKTITELKLHGFYVSDGMMCYVDYIGKQQEVFGRQKERIRVIFENGTESNMYLRTLSSELYRNGYIVSDNIEKDEDNIDSVGYIYILKSLSTDPKITTIKDLYKIGVTRGTVENRIKDAANDPTYLMAPVKIVDTYKLTGDYQPVKVEAMIHRVFADAKVAMTITDKNGLEYVPEEWYSVPISIINEAIDLIDSGEISYYAYDSKSQSIISLKGKK